MNRCFRDYLLDKTIFVALSFLGLFAIFFFCFCFTLFVLFFSFSLLLIFSICALFFPSPDGRLLLRNKVLSVVRLFFQPY